MTRPLSPMLRAFAQLIGAIVILDGVAIAAFKLADMDHRAIQTRQIFVAVWTVASALVVALGLSRMKRVRRAARDARAKNGG